MTKKEQAKVIADQAQRLDELTAEVARLGRETNKLEGLHVHNAVNSAGAPICIGDRSDAGLAVNLYLMPDEPGIRGVEVTEGPDVLARAGWLPVEVFDE